MSLTRIQQSAKGKPCLLRVPHVCRGRRDTVVHCHVRLFGAGGTGLKPNDLIGIRACFECHDWLDDRTGSRIHFDIKEQLILGGLVRTLDALVREEVIDPP